MTPHKRLPRRLARITTEEQARVNATELVDFILDHELTPDEMVELLTVSLLGVSGVMGAAEVVMRVTRVAQGSELRKEEE